MTVDKLSWGHRNNAKLEDYLTSSELIKGKNIFIILLQSNYRILWNRTRGHGQLWWKYSR